MSFFVPAHLLTIVCFVCISEVIKRQALCPMDRHPIALASLLEVPPDATDTFDEHPITPSTRSAKITELVRYLKAFDGEDKTLVFSQFTSFLDRVAAVLQEEGIKFCRFDGSMPAKKVGSSLGRCSPVLAIRYTPCGGASGVRAAHGGGEGVGGPVPSRHLAAEADSSAGR